MNLCKIRKRGVVLLCLSLIFYAGQTSAFPLPTMDMSRLAQSAKTVKLQIDQLKQEYESNMHIIKQIQNGGYAAAARELFGKVQNGDYGRYGDMVKDLGVSLETGVANAQAAISKKAKREEINEKLAQKELDRKKKEAAEAETKALQHQKESEGLAKKSAWNKAYSWMKKNSVSSVNLIDSGVSTISNGGSLKDLIKNTKGSAGDIFNNMKEDAKEEAAIKEKQEQRAKEEEKKQAEQATYEQGRKEFEESQKERDAEDDKTSQDLTKDFANQLNLKK